MPQGVVGCFGAEIESSVAPAEVAGPVIVGGAQNAVVAIGMSRGQMKIVVVVDFRYC